jgi:hypothetical protein
MYQFVPTLRYEGRDAYVVSNSVFWTLFVVEFANVAFDEAWPLGLKSRLEPEIQLSCTRKFVFLQYGNNTPSLQYDIVYENNLC